jgi:hypothetical protein
MTQQLTVRENFSVYPKTVEEARRFMNRKATMTQAFEAAQLILSSYPQNVNPTNAECYATQVVALLSTYPPEVVAKIARPVDGIVGKLKWLPSVAEIKAEADSFMRIPRQMVERHECEMRQIAERGKSIESKPVTPKQLETWKKLKANWGK